MLVLKTMRLISDTHWTPLQLLVVQDTVLPPVRVSILGAAVLYLRMTATPAPPMEMDHQ